MGFISQGEPFDAEFITTPFSDYLRAGLGLNCIIVLNVHPETPVRPPPQKKHKKQQQSMQCSKVSLASVFLIIDIEYLIFMQYIGSELLKYIHIIYIKGYQ